MINESRGKDKDRAKHEIKKHDAGARYRQEQQPVHDPNSHDFIFSLCYLMAEKKKQREENMNTREE
ncbi:uncharacterized protein DS421_12g384180 [Arachis hypogaea]|nr:uncharacterized protein DS421_12g384180 [Arachis hypogaea]